MGLPGSSHQKFVGLNLRSENKSYNFFESHHTGAHNSGYLQCYEWLSDTISFVRVFVNRISVVGDVGLGNEDEPPTRVIPAHWLGPSGSGRLISAQAFEFQQFLQLLFRLCRLRVYEFVTA